MAEPTSFLQQYWYVFALIVFLIVIHRWISAYFGGRVNLATEFPVVWAALLTYYVVRGVSGQDREWAMTNARHVVDFEKAVGLFHEEQMQAFVMRFEPLTKLFNWVYVWWYWPMILGVLTWLCIWKPDRYLYYRNAMLFSGAIGLSMFLLFPLAPPRFLNDMGFVDTIATGSSFSDYVRPASLTNHYAAMPSFHLGWNFLLAVAIVRNAGHYAWRGFGMISPMMMFLAIIVTGNHYIIDGFAGLLVAMAGLKLAGMWERRSETPELQHEMVPISS